MLYSLELTEFEVVFLEEFLNRKVEDLHVLETKVLSSENQRAVRYSIDSAARLLFKIKSIDLPKKAFQWRTTRLRRWKNDRIRTIKKNA